MLYIVMVVMGTLIGWCTNIIAIWLLFRPYKPVQLGPWQFQGLLPRRQSDIARNIGHAIEKELLAASDFTDQLDSPEIRKNIMAAFLNLAHQEINQRLPWYLPSPLRQRLIDYLSNLAEQQGEELVDKIVEGITSNLSQLDVGTLIEYRLNSLPLQELEMLSWKLAGRELRYIEYVGGALGGVIGLLQAIIISLGKDHFL
ncbi:MAG TPA: DUF445 family protein [Firmicutes bacterium]|nr:DUF445 family protein [Bacillota bacterium]